MFRPTPSTASRPIRRRAVLAGALAAGFALPALPMPAGAQDLGTIIDRMLTEYERAVIREYLRNDGYWVDRHDGGGRGRGNGRGRGGLPPGLQRQVDQGRGLPPGLARQIQRGEGLPPGLQAQALPGDLLSRLPRREGTRRVLIDRNVVLIDTATNIILDILTAP